MRRLATLNLAQRIVAVVALAGVLRTLGGYVVGRLIPTGGWFSYPPLSGEALPGGGLPTTGWRSVVATLVWLGLIAAWGLLSIWLLGLPRHQDAEAPRQSS